MKNLLSILVLIATVCLISSCSIGYSSGMSNEDRGLTCPVSTIKLKNMSNSPVVLQVAKEEHLVYPGDKLKFVTPAVETEICIGVICNTINLVPCWEYDFSPETVQVFSSELTYKNE